MIDAQGCQLIGTFADDKLQGQGEMRSSIQSFTGEFKDGKACGKGILTWQDDCGRSMKFTGTFDLNGYVSGKFEKKF